MHSASSGPQKHITKVSDGFHNHFTLLTMSYIIGSLGNDENTKKAIGLY